MRELRWVFIAWMLAFDPANAATELLNGVAAVVYQTPITVDDVQGQSLPVEEVLFQQYGRQPAILNQKIREVRQKTLERLIERQLILHEFETAGYNLPESVIDDRIKDRIRKQFGDRLTLTKTLQARGMTYEAFRREIRHQVIVDALTQKNVSSAIVVSPFEIGQYYKAHLEKFQQKDRIHLRMIFIRKAPADHGAARELLGEIRQKIEDGVPFAEMAFIYHQGSQRGKGGDWGWVDQSVLRKDLTPIAFGLKPGQMSEVIERDDGCYLMYVEATKQAEPKPLDEVRQEIEKTLKAEERNRLRKQWIAQLRKKAYIRYY